MFLARLRGSSTTRLDRVSFLAQRLTGRTRFLLVALALVVLLAAAQYWGTGQLVTAGVVLSGINLFLLVLFRPIVGIVTSPRMAERGYDRLTLDQLELLTTRHGAEALKRLPRWSELATLPGVDANDQFGSVSRVMAMAAWGCEPRHLALRLLGYRELNEKDADRLLEKHGAASFASLPFAERDADYRDEEGLSEFEYLDDALAASVAYEQAERDLARAERAGERPRVLDLAALAKAPMPEGEAP